MKIELGNGYEATIDDEDCVLVSQVKWCAAVDRKRNLVYAIGSGRRNDKQYTVRMHRLILGITDSSLHVDHKDGDGLNNRRINLRVCTSKQNSHNQKKRPGKSRFKGVSRSGNRWMSRITESGQTFYLGIFGTELEAAQAYNKKAIELHGEFARPNIVVIPCDL